MLIGCFIYITFHIISKQNNRFNVEKYFHDAFRMIVLNPDETLVFDKIYLCKELDNNRVDLILV